MPRWLPLLFACAFAMPSPSHGQECDDIFLENATLGTIHYLKTDFVKVIVRSNYDYSMSFKNNGEGLYMVVQTRNGGVLNFNDEIIFIN